MSAPLADGEYVAVLERLFNSPASASIFLVINQLCVLSALRVDRRRY